MFVTLYVLGNCSEAMLDSLPPAISHDILLRLPVRCLLICTAVRKSWRSMIRPGLVLLLGSSGGEVEEFYSLHFDDPSFEEYCKIEITTLGEMGRGNECFRVVGT